MQIDFPAGIPASCYIGDNPLVVIELDFLRGGYLAREDFYKRPRVNVPSLIV